MALSDLIKGGYGAITSQSPAVLAQTAAGQQLGSWGVPAELNPFTPAPTPAPPPTSPTQSLAKEDQQPQSGGLSALWMQYKRLILTGAAVVGGLFLLVLVSRKRK